MLGITRFKNILRMDYDEGRYHRGKRVSLSAYVFMGPGKEWTRNVFAVYDYEGKKLYYKRELFLEESQAVQELKRGASGECMLDSDLDLMNIIRSYMIEGYVSEKDIIGGTFYWRS